MPITPEKTRLLENLEAQIGEAPRMKIAKGDTDPVGSFLRQLTAWIAWSGKKQLMEDLENFESRNR